MNTNHELRMCSESSFLVSPLGTLKGGQEARDSKRDFLVAAAVAFGSGKVLGLFASDNSLVKGDNFEVQRIKIS